MALNEEEDSNYKNKEKKIVEEVKEEFLNDDIYVHHILSIKNGIKKKIP